MLIELLIVAVASPSTQIVQDALENQILGPGFTVAKEYCGLLIKVDIQLIKKISLSLGVLMNMRYLSWRLSLIR